MLELSVRVRKLSNDAVLPTRATDGSACHDLYASESAVVYPSLVACVGTGIAVEVPTGYFLEIRPRSGKAMEGLMLANGPGTVDCDYRGEVKVLLTSLDIRRHVAKGERIAQCRVVPIIPVQFMEVGQLSKTERGEDGFGSTGQ